MVLFSCEKQTYRLLLWQDVFKSDNLIQRYGRSKGICKEKRCNKKGTDTDRSFLLYMTFYIRVAEVSVNKIKRREQR